MSKINVGSVLKEVAANVASGGLYAYGKAADKAIKGKPLAGAADALASTGYAGNVLQPTVGTKNALMIEGAAAGGALAAPALTAPAAAGGLGGGSEAAALAAAEAAGDSSIYTSAIGPAAVTGDPLASSVIAPVVAPVPGAGSIPASQSQAAPGAAPATTAAPAGGNGLQNLAAVGSIAGTGASVAGAMKKPQMPELPAAPAPATSDNTQAEQSAAAARVEEQNAKRTRTLLTSGQGASNYGKNSFAPSLIGNNSYLKSVIG